MRKPRPTRVKNHLPKGGPSLHDLPPQWGDKSRPSYSWSVYELYQKGYTDQYGKTK